MHWYYIFSGVHRVNVACDALEETASQAQLEPICERFVQSLTISG